MAALCPYANNLYGFGRQCPETSVGIKGCYVWGSGCPIRAGGDIYSKSMTMEDDEPTRFETEITTLRDLLIHVETHSMLLGTVAAQVFPVEDFSSIRFKRTDISGLYFRNQTPGQNGKITILGVADPRE